MAEASPVQRCSRPQPHPVYFTEAPGLQLSVATPKRGSYEQYGKRVDFLKRLPFELSSRILALLDFHSLLAVSVVSRHWRALYHDNDLWRHLMAEQNWQVEPPFPSRDLCVWNERQYNWHYLYKQKYQLMNRWKTGRVSTHMLIGHQKAVYCLQFDQNMLVTGSQDRKIKIWDLKTYQCIGTLKGHQGSVFCLKYKDNILVSGSSDSTVVVWDINHLRPIKQLKGHTNGVTAVCFDDQHIISASKDKTIRIWDFATGQLVRIITGHDGPVNSIELEGDRLVSGSGDSTLRMWDIRTGTCIRKFVGHEHGVTCIRFDGTRIVSGSNDQTIKVWDAETGLNTMTLYGHTGLVRSLQFDHEKIVSSGYDRTVRVWSISTGDCLLSFESSQSSWVFDAKFDKSRIISARQDSAVLVMDFADGVDTRQIT
ncbi:WD40-repeat-containing domain protein [Dichotomocladium elegans]|nr:WD40-repeat-containing domain protein [Dichotomocladium elegans]